MNEYRKTAQEGFTLIELMIVVAIIGILAAIAIPMYQDYVAKSQVTRAYSELSALKTAVATNLADGEYPNATDEASAQSYGYTDSNLLSNVAITFASGSGGAGEIVGTLGQNASSALTTQTITLDRTDEGIWTCDVSIDEYAPAGCS